MPTSLFDYVEGNSLHARLGCCSKIRSSSALRCMRPACNGHEGAVQAEVLAAALHADAWPHLTLALGLATGQVLLLRGEAGVPNADMC